MLTLETSAFKPFTVANLRHQLNYPVMIIYCFIPANAVSLNSTPQFFLCGLWLQVGFQWKTEHLQWHQDQRFLSPTESKTIFLILLKPECQIYNNYSCYYDDLLTDGIFFIWNAGLCHSLEKAITFIMNSHKDLVIDINAL